MIADMRAASQIVTVDGPESVAAFRICVTGDALR